MVCFLVVTSRQLEEVAQTCNPNIREAGLRRVIMSLLAWVVETLSAKGVGKGAMEE